MAIFLLLSSAYAQKASNNIQGILYCASDAHAGFWRFFRAEDETVHLTEDSPTHVLDNAILIEMRYQPPTPEDGE